MYGLLSIKYLNIKGRRLLYMFIFFKFDQLSVWFVCQFYIWHWWYMYTTCYTQCTINVNIKLANRSMGSNWKRKKNILEFDHFIGQKCCRHCCYNQWYCSIQMMLLSMRILNLLNLQLEIFYHFWFNHFILIYLTLLRRVDNTLYDSCSTSVH